LYIAETTQNIRTFWVAVPAAKGGGGQTELHIYVLFNP